MPSGAARASGSSNPLPQGLEQRVASLEEKLRSLPKAHGKTAASGPCENCAEGTSQEAAVLSIVARENSRIRDVQLEWHRARWGETRQQQLAVFAGQHKLRPEQTAELNRALEHELDAMVSILKRPDAAEDPDQAATDWQSVLKETESRVKTILTPEQEQAWMQGRVFERRVLWPWLPQEDKQ